MGKETDPSSKPNSPEEEKPDREKSDTEERVRCPKCGASFRYQASLAWLASLPMDSCISPQACGLLRYGVARNILFPRERGGR